jgi:hypothetical protein
MSLAESGHNSTIAWESATVTNGIIGAPTGGVFTAIPELQGDLKGFSGSREVTATTPHGEDIDSKVTGPISRNASQFTINFNPTNAVHLALRAAFLATTVALRRRGWRFWGPNGSAGVDEVIQSGEITEWDDTSPEGAGIRQVTISVEFAKAAKIDGVVYGTAA